MKFEVTDEAVREFADRLRRRESAVDVFPAKMSECEFTPEQREIIKAARREKEAFVKSLKKPSLSPSETTLPPEPRPPSPPKPSPPKPTPRPDPAKNAPAKHSPQPNPPKVSGLRKIERLLYLQQHKCFFCGQPLKTADATIEHLMPLSQGGKREESNEVACHRSVNEAFGSMNLKSKIEFILRTSGQFRCPKGK